MEHYRNKRMNFPYVVSRRQFLSHGCGAMLGAGGIISALAQLQAIGAMAADASTTPKVAAALPIDYKALVCIFLGGGNDATNLLIPSDSASYSRYAAVRAEIAVSRESLLQITTRRYRDGREYGMNPVASELRSLFAQGKLAVLANVGVLAKPTTLAEFNAGRSLPPHLFSHSNQNLLWQSSIGEEALPTGWGGRLADIVNVMNSKHDVSMSITLSGLNRFQRGDVVQPLAMTSGAVITPYYPAFFNADGRRAHPRAR
jgi:uncharacterized protein (DUF1501 family)